MHHQMRIRNASVDFLDALNRQNIAGRLTGKFIRTVTGANRNRQRINLGLLDKICGLIRVGQQLAMRHDIVSAVAVFLVALHGFQRAQAAQLAFD